MGVLLDRVAVISGGARGQGAAEARLFAQEGATVVVGDLLADEGEALAEEIRQSGGKARFHKLDVSSEEEWATLAAFVSAEFGKAHVLINNAGITHRAGTLGTSYDDWNRVMSVNLSGAFLGIKAMTPLMRAAGQGAIVNVGSVAGLTGYHSVAYGTSKWGLIGLTKSAAIELVDFNIRVNAISPGVIETPLATGAAQNFGVVSSVTPQGRSGKPEEIAELVLFLVSDRSSFITGEQITIDGGLFAGGLFRPIAVKTGVFPHAKSGD